MLRRYLLYLKKHPLVTAALAIVYAMVCLKSLPGETFFRAMLLRTLLCGAMIFFLYQVSGNAKAVVTDKLTRTLTGLFLNAFGQQTLAHTNGIGKLSDIKLTVHVVMLQNVGSALHETLGRFRLLLVSFHTTLPTLLHALLVGQDILDTRLQSLGGIRFLKDFLNWYQQLLSFLTAKDCHT